MSLRTRRVLVAVLTAASSVFLTLALVAGYALRAGVDSDQFSNRAVVALHDDNVRALAAERITDDIVLRQEGNLLAARPIIQSVTSAVIGSRAFTTLFRSAVRDVHRSLFHKDRNTVVLTVADVGTVVAAALQKLRPSLARKLEKTRDVQLVRRDVGGLGGGLARTAERVRVLALLLLVATVLAAAGALLLSPDKRRTVERLGIGAAAGGVALIVAYGVTRAVAIDHVQGPEGRAAAAAVWDAFLGDFRTAAWILAGSGAVVAASAASLIRPVDVRDPLRRLGRLAVTEPDSQALRVVRGVCLVGIGLVVMLRRDAVLRLLFALAGIYLVYQGVNAILRVVYRPPAPERAPARATRRRAPAARKLAVPAIAAVLILAAVAVFVGGGGTTTAAPPTGACLGHAVLCDRPLDRVVLPATHNSMSVPLPGWYSAEQERPIRDQLSDGIRGLLLDTYYADRLPNGKIRTYFGERAELRKRASRDGVSADAVDAAQRIRARAGFGGKGKRGIYLCHGFCELGATPLRDVLTDIHTFLVANPGEVVVVINQDYVTPEDFVAAVKRAGLEDIVYRGPTAGDWPTLREMIDQNQRLLLLAENHGGAAPWYHLAYDRITEETPYAFSKVAQLTKQAELPASCRPNRGPARAPLFLVNHWVSTDPLPLPSNAAKVNAYDPLLRRARECQRIRQHVPNLVAVNFYREGDLFRVVDTLNGLR